MTLQRCLYAVLEVGADDWVHAPEVAYIAKWVGRAFTSDAVRELSLEILREGARQALIEVGDLLGEGGRFREWEIPIPEALGRIEREWIALGRNPELGELFWIKNTGKGDEIGKSLIELWNAPQDLSEKMLMRSALYGSVDLEWISWLVEVVGMGTPKTNLKSSIDLMQMVLHRGLMEIGDLENGEFRKWQLSIDECLSRVESEWRALGIEPAGWLQNTPRGQQLGEELLLPWKSRLK